MMRLYYLVAREQGTGGLLICLSARLVNSRCPVSDTEEMWLKKPQGSFDYSYELRLLVVRTIKCVFDIDTIYFLSRSGRIRIYLFQTKN